MRKPGTTNNYLLDWILVLALALSPLQSAWSAFDSSCQHEQAMQGVQSGGQMQKTGSVRMTQHRPCSHHSAQNSVSGSSSKAGDCCCHTQGKGDGHCAGNCQPVPAALYLPPLKLAFSLEFFTEFNSQQPVFNDGRTVPPPYQPPRG